MFGTKGLEARYRGYFVVGGKICAHPSFPNLPSLKKVSPDITHVFQVSLLSQPSELVSDDDCLYVISRLNEFRSMRVENLGDGYYVSGTLCYDIDS